MKTKKFEKKLGLNKETIANLKKDQLDHLKGGKPDDKSLLGTCPFFSQCGCVETLTCETCDTC
jgi:hypothetical protein